VLHKEGEGRISIARACNLRYLTLCARADDVFPPFYALKRRFNGTLSVNLLFQKDARREMHLAWTRAILDAIIIGFIERDDDFAKRELKSRFQRINNEIALVRGEIYYINDLRCSAARKQRRDQNPKYNREA